MPNDIAKLKQLYDVLKTCEETNYPFAEPDRTSLLENLKYFNSLIDNALGRFSSIPSRDPEGCAEINLQAERVIHVIQNLHDFSDIDKEVKSCIGSLKYVSRHVFDKPVPEGTSSLPCIFLLAYLVFLLFVDDELFFFNVIENNKSEIRIIQYDQNGSLFFEKIFSSFDLNRKNIKIGDKVFMPDRKMDIVKEGVRYFLIVFGEKFFELRPNRFVNPYDIDIVPIGKNLFKAFHLSKFCPCR